MDFNVKNFGVIEIGGIEIWITETMVSTWIVMALLIGFAIVVRVKVKKFTEVPSTRFQNAVETMIEMFEGFVRSSAGPKLSFIGAWYFMVFAFILTSNLSGLLTLRPPTADWTVTFTFALSTFFLIQVMGVKFRKGAYVKTFFEPHPVFFPLNLIGELARPISLSFRLFGNILAGMILMSLLYTLAPIYVRFGIPAALHAYFDVAMGLLQTYIFCVLSLSFIGAAAATEDA